MATITQVAQEAGVSKTTVSRILNKQGNFSDETIRTVLETAKRLGYQPNEIARALGRNKSKTIALVFPTKYIPGFVQIQSSLEEAFYNLGYKIMLYSSLFDREKEEKTIKMMENNMIDGVVFGSFSNDISHITKSSLPVITAGRRIAAGVSSVKANDKGAGILAAKHLLSKECKKMIYLTSHPDGIQADERYKGFRQIIEQSDASLWAYEISMEEQIQNNFSSAINRMIIEHPDADGIFAETDILALSCIQNYSKLAYKIPEDIKIVGYGDMFFSQLSNPALTTIKYDDKQFADEIANLLIEMIETGNNEERNIELPVYLIERQTT